MAVRRAELAAANDNRVAQAEIRVANARAETAEARTETVTAKAEAIIARERAAQLEAELFNEITKSLQPGDPPPSRKQPAPAGSRPAGNGGRPAGPARRPGDSGSGPSGRRPGDGSGSAGRRPDGGPSGPAGRRPGDAAQRGNPRQAPIRWWQVGRQAKAVVRGTNALIDKPRTNIAARMLLRGVVRGTRGTLRWYKNGVDKYGQTPPRNK